MKKFNAEKDTSFLPDNFLMMEISSNKQNIRKVSKIYKDNTAYLFERKKEKLILVEKIKNLKGLSKLLVDNVFAKYDYNKGWSDNKNCSELIYDDDAATEYFHPRYLEECWKK